MSKNLNSICMLREPEETASPHPIAAAKMAAIESGVQVVRMSFSIHKGMQTLHHWLRTTSRRSCDAPPESFEITHERFARVEPRAGYGVPTRLIRGGSH